MPIAQFKSGINRIGQAMTTCTSVICKGHLNNPAIGALPRCLFFDDRISKRQRASHGNSEEDLKKTEEPRELVIAVGLNPGESDATLRNNLRNVTNYQVAVDQQPYQGHNYYKFSTQLVDMLNPFAPILWTEIAKCEDQSKKPKIQLTNETKAHCAGRYLVQEVALARLHFTRIKFIAFAIEAYYPLIFLFPNDKVLGVPHPTGSYGKKFHRTINANQAAIITFWNNTTENHFCFK